MINFLASLIGIDADEYDCNPETWESEDLDDDDEDYQANVKGIDDDEPKKGWFSLW